MNRQPKFSYIPNWSKKSIIYQIYPLGFCDCPPINPIAKPNPQLKQIQPINRLSKIRQYYTHFQKLGINTIILGPIFESCTHGYDTINYHQIDRRLGTNQLFKEIVHELHQQNIKIIIDVAFNHTSRLFPAFIDIKNNQEKSKYIDWYQNINFEQDTVWKDGYSYKYWQDIVELPCLNTKNSDVKKYIFSITQHWLKEYDIDGWRLDVAYNISPEFWREFRLVCQDIKPNCFLIGELIDQDYTQWVNPKTLDSATNYPLYQNICNAFSQNDIFQLEEIINIQINLQKQNLVLTNFIGNHDTNRLFNRIHQKYKLKQIFNLLYMLPGLPSIYYGDEILLNGEKHPIHDNNIRQPMPYLNKISDQQKEFQKHITNLIKIRQNDPQITTGQLSILYSQQNTLAIGIKTDQNFYINITHLSTHPLTSPIYISKNKNISENSKFADLLSPSQTYQFVKNQILPPTKGTILKMIDRH